MWKNKSQFYPKMKYVCMHFKNASHDHSLIAVTNSAGAPTLNGLSVVTSSSKIEEK